MTALEYILDGLEAELALERELGVRVIECDRSLLAPCNPPGPPPTPPSPAGRAASPLAADSMASPQAAPRRAAASAAVDIAFLHDKALTPAGVDMMEKIVKALGKTPETAPVVVGGPLPRAKAYVVLGGLALRKWFPGVGAAPGQWVSTELSPNVLVTYSPAYILRFGAGTPAVQQIKKDMWVSLKSVLRRIQTS